LSFEVCDGSLKKELILPKQTFLEKNDDYLIDLSAVLIRKAFYFV